MFIVLKLNAIYWWYSVGPIVEAMVVFLLLFHDYAAKLHGDE